MCRKWFGWAVMRVFIAGTGGVGAITVPIGQILAYFALAAVAGVAASVVPARQRPATRSSGPSRRHDRQDRRNPRAAGVSPISRVPRDYLIASAFAGEPVPPGTFNGALVRKNS
jgi:hypothetical protein